MGSGLGFAGFMPSFGVQGVMGLNYIKTFHGSLSQDFFGEPPKEMPKVLLRPARSVEQDCNAIRPSALSVLACPVLSRTPFKTLNVE